jgi:hypothetical protein
MDSLSEKQIEKKFVDAVRGIGGIALKFVSPGMAGVPDRLVLIGGRAYFAEMKAPGEKMRPLQLRRKKLLEWYGFKVFCVDSPEKIDEVIREIGGDV